MMRGCVRGVMMMGLLMRSAMAQQLLEVPAVASSTSGAIDAEADFDANQVLDIWITDFENDRIFLG